MGLRWDRIAESLLRTPSAGISAYRLFLSRQYMVGERAAEGRYYQAYRVLLFLPGTSPMRSH